MALRALIHSEIHQITDNTRATYIAFSLFRRNNISHPRFLLFPLRSWSPKPSQNPSIFIAQKALRFLSIEIPRRRSWSSPSTRSWGGSRSPRAPGHGSSSGSVSPGSSSSLRQPAVITGGGDCPEIQRISGLSSSALNLHLIPNHLPQLPAFPSLASPLPSPTSGWIFLIYFW